MKQQTAVEWLQKQLECFGNKHELQMSWATVDELLEQAKEMEKEQIIGAFKTGTKMVDVENELDAIFNAIIYYKETYESND
jgi:hypothetical protein